MKVLKRVLAAFVLLAAGSSFAHGKVPFRVVSDPAGATVQLNGRTIGLTPVEIEVEDYLVKGHGVWLFSKYLRVPMTMTVSMEGYFSKTVEITRGPFRWTNSNGTAMHVYYVIADTRWSVKLDKKVEFTSTNPFALPANPSSDPAGLASWRAEVALSGEQVVSASMPSVVTIRAGDGSGSGFFITEGGVIVTNRHVVGSNTSAKVITSQGVSLDSVSIYSSPDRDLALIKVNASACPYLRLASPASISAGSEVLAIGSPGIPGRSGGVLAGTVTRGIVSAVRNTNSDGLLVQTDVAINPGNSGGPLLNMRGEVVGVNTMGFVAPGVAGLNFAVMSNEVLDLLEKQFDYVPSYLGNSTESGVVAKDMSVSPAGSVRFGMSPLAASAKPDGRAEAGGLSVVTVKCDTDGADIVIDGKFLGNTPSTVRLAPGDHVLSIEKPGFKAWQRTITMTPGGNISIDASLEKTPALRIE
jgi:serine protease Do